MFRKNKGQSIAEYAVLLSLVIAAVVAMQVYVKRGLQAKVKSGTDAFTSAGAGQSITVDGGGSATLKKVDQYEPYYQDTDYKRYQESVEQEHMGSGQIVKEKVSDVTGATGSEKQGVDMTKGSKNWDSTDTGGGTE